MDKFTIARTLDEIARYIELNDPNKFKSRAFERAARAVEGLEEEIETLAKSRQLLSTPGIGKATGAVIEELLRTGTSKYLEELRAQYPPGVFDLLRVPGFGIKKIAQVHEALGVTSMDELEAAARDGSLAKLKGFGAKTAEKILGGIAFARRHESRFLLPAGIEVAELLRERLAGIAEVEDAEIAGSVRRRLEIISNVDVVIATHDAPAVVEALGSLVDNLQRLDQPSGAELTTAASVHGMLRGEMDVRFHVVPPGDFGAVLLRATGSTEFVAKLEQKIATDDWELRENGLFHHGRHVQARTEQEVFEKIGISFVEPERREGTADLARRKRTELVHVSDIRGTFHVHTTFSDGRNSVEEMLEAARAQGYDYVGLSDHSKAAHYAGGLTESRLRERLAEIERQRPAFAPMRVFNGTEADILPDGSIDYDLETLAEFDFVIASVHSRFTMDKDEMTERMLLALDNPYVTFLGHMTGRKLLNRDGYTFDLDRIFDRAAERGVMIEINGNPNRLDIDWRLIGRARDRGVEFSIHPDAHSIHEYAAVISGSWVARKAGLSAREIFNAKPAEEVAEYLAKRKARASA